MFLFIGNQVCRSGVDLAVSTIDSFRTADRYSLLSKNKYHEAKIEVTTKETVVNVFFDTRHPRRHFLARRRGWTWVALEGKTWVAGVDLDSGTGLRSLLHRYWLSDVL